MQYVAAHEGGIGVAGILLAIFVGAMEDSSVLPPVVFLIDVDVTVVIWSIVELVMLVGTYVSVGGIASHNVNIIFYYSKLDIEMRVRKVEILSMYYKICNIYHFGFIMINKL
jgi:hypothetical protein